MKSISSPLSGRPCVEISHLRYSGELGTGCVPSVRRVRFDKHASPAVLHFRSQDADAVSISLKPVRHTNGLEHAAARPELLGCTFRSLRLGLSLRAERPFDVVSFILPTQAISKWAKDAGVRSFCGLCYPPDTVLEDDVIGNFALAMLPSLEEPQTASRLFVDYVLQAVGVHVTRTFGCSPASRIRGGLAAWQERRAKDLMAAAPDLRISLGELAAECRLSVCHFVKAFRQSTGQTPYQWQLRRRIDVAKSLLNDADLPLAEVAAACGFSDQSHFTRAFSKTVDMSPGAWRRWSQGLVEGTYGRDDRR